MVGYGQAARWYLREDFPLRSQTVVQPKRASSEVLDRIEFEIKPQGIIGRGIVERCREQHAVGYNDPDCNRCGSRRDQLLTNFPSLGEIKPGKAQPHLLGFDFNDSFLMLFLVHRIFRSVRFRAKFHGILLPVDIRVR